MAERPVTPNSAYRMFRRDSSVRLTECRQEACRWASRSQQYGPEVARAMEVAWEASGASGPTGGICSWTLVDRLEQRANHPRREARAESVGRSSSPVVGRTLSLSPATPASRPGAWQPLTSEGWNTNV